MFDDFLNDLFWIIASALVLIGIARVIDGLIALLF